MVIDRGANVGTHTVSWSSGMTGRGEVWAFEPQERVFYALCGNIAQNNVLNAHAYMKALSNEYGVCSIPKSNHDRPFSSGSIQGGN